jgi:hypothetical protein
MDDQEDNTTSGEDPSSSEDSSSLSSNSSDSDADYTSDGNVSPPELVVGQEGQGLLPQTPQKKRYRKTLHYGMNKRSTRYYQSASGIDMQSGVDQSTASSSVDRVGDTQNVPMQDVHDHDVIEDDDVCQTVVSDHSSAKSSTSGGSMIDTSSDSDSSWMSEEQCWSSSESCSSERDAPRNTGSDSDMETPQFQSGYLYSGSRHTYLTSYTDSMLFSMKYSLPREGFSDLLRLVASHLPTSTKYLTSVYKMKSFLNNYIGDCEPKVHKFCEHCSQLIDAETNQCLSDDCRNSSAKVGEFLDLRLEDQLKSLLQGKYVIINHKILASLKFSEFNARNDLVATLS